MYKVYPNSIDDDNLVMSSDFCDGYICGELLGPPPIPPVDLLPRIECHDIISECNAVSSLKGAYSNYSDPCLFPSTISTSAATSPDAGFPAWLIGVIAVVVIAIIIIIVVVITCIVRSTKGERYLSNIRKVISNFIQFMSDQREKLKRSKISKWLSTHLQGLGRCRKYFKSPTRSSTKNCRDIPKISLPDIIQEPQTPCSAGSPLTDREPVDFCRGPDACIKEPDEFSLKLNLTSDTFSEEIFKELNQSSGEYENTGNYCELTSNPYHSNSNHYENYADHRPTVDNQKVVIYVNTSDIHSGKGNNSSTANGYQPTTGQHRVKARTLGNEDLTMKLRNLDVSNDDIVLFDKDSVQSLTVDSGYASRQVSNDNCTC